MTHLDFRLATGGVIGRDHRITSRNYQDACHIDIGDDLTIAVVTDGCGSSRFSEVGANLGARLLTEALRSQKPGAINWEQVQQHLLSGIDVLARQMGGDYARTIQDYFLFTIVGVVLTRRRVVFFALGDGAIIVNGVITKLGPFAGNMPPYAAYRLLRGSLRIDPDLIAISSVIDISITELESFVIGSDGLNDLIAAADCPLPGMDEACGSVSQFWEQNRYFSHNPDLVSRRLRLIARDWPKHDPDPGLLADDTTLVVGRLNRKSS